MVKAQTRPERTRPADRGHSRLLVGQTPRRQSEVEAEHAAPSQSRQPSSAIEAGVTIPRPASDRAREQPGNARLHC